MASSDPTHSDAAVMRACRTCGASGTKLDQEHHQQVCPDAVVVSGPFYTFHTPWEVRRPLALCKDDKCPFKHSGVSLSAASNAADAHVEETGHEVVIYREEFKTVRPHNG